MEARVSGLSHNFRGTCGTVDYFCPELINEETYGTGLDIWCMGIILYEFYYFKTPFQDKST